MGEGHVLEVSEGQFSGVFINDQNVVTYVYPLVHEKLRSGDRLTHINGTKPYEPKVEGPLRSCRTHCEAQKLTFAPSTSTRAATPKAAAYSAPITITIPFRRATPLGLVVKAVGAYVIVFRLVPESLAFESQLMVGDRILQLEGQPIVDKETLQKRLIKHLEKEKPATLVIERPESWEARIEAAVNVDATPPS